MVCNEASKRGEYHREFVDESQQDISGLIQLSVIPLAEKSASKMISFVKAGTNRMSQRRFPNPGQAVDPVYIALLVLTGSFGRPAHDLIEEEFAGAVDTAGMLAVVCLDRSEAPKQKLLLCNEVIENEPPRGISAHLSL